MPPRRRRRRAEKRAQLKAEREAQKAQGEAVSQNPQTTPVAGGPGGELDPELAPKSQNPQPPQQLKRPRGQRNETGLSEIHDGRLTNLAVERGWIKPEDRARWPTRKPRKELTAEIAKRGDITPVEQAVLTACHLMDSKDERAKGIGSRIITMQERQNQADDHKAAPDLHMHAVAHHDVDYDRETRERNLILSDPGYLEFLRQQAIEGANESPIQGQGPIDGDGAEQPDQGQCESGEPR